MAMVCVSACVCVSVRVCVGASVQRSDGADNGRVPAESGAILGVESGLPGYSGLASLQAPRGRFSVAPLGVCYSAGLQERSPEF